MSREYEIELHAARQEGADNMSPAEAKDLFERVMEEMLQCRDDGAMDESYEEDFDFMVCALATLTTGYNPDTVHKVLHTAHPGYKFHTKWRCLDDLPWHHELDPEEG